MLERVEAVAQGLANIVGHAKGEDYNWLHLSPEQQDDFRIQAGLLLHEGAPELFPATIRGWARNLDG